jgi:adhesin/invasin
VTLVGAGETVISATFAGNDEYLPATASYKLTVAEVIEPIDPELAFSVTEVNAVLEQAFTSPVLANPYGVEVEWQSVDETVATVDQNGKVTLVGEGETVISVTFSGNDEYLPATASYTLNVNLPTNIML